jgi:hypothetical protein
MINLAALQPLYQMYMHVCARVHACIHACCNGLKCGEFFMRFYMFMCCSEWGALQLLVDFGSVPDWLEGCPWLQTEVRNHLAHSEVLRRCEGVGRLLLRHPGEPIAMVSPISTSKGKTGKVICPHLVFPWVNSALFSGIKCND